jgi:apolipoprotein D and lipocalin family protein
VKTRIGFTSVLRRYCVGAALAASTLVLASCSVGVAPPDDPSLIRNPTVPIGAIQRFDLQKFDGDWQVHSSAGGDWALSGFTVSQGGTQWRGPSGAATIMPRATGILRLTYADETQRDLWVIWTDPDHHTVAIGNPEGDFGFIATRTGRFRVDQVTAAAQVLDFNGYRTTDWDVRAR